MPVIDEIIEYLKERDLSVKKKGNVIKATNNDLPISLTIRFEKKSCIIELIPEEDLNDALVDLVESEEDVEDYVDGILSEMRDTAIEVSKILEKNGYSVSLKIREGENDIRDMIEEVVEEYTMFTEEEEL